MLPELSQRPESFASACWLSPIGHLDRRSCPHPYLIDPALVPAPATETLVRLEVFRPSSLPCAEDLLRAPENVSLFAHALSDCSAPADCLVRYRKLMMRQAWTAARAPEGIGEYRQRFPHDKAQGPISGIEIAQTEVQQSSLGCLGASVLAMMLLDSASVESAIYEHPTRFRNKGDRVWYECGKFLLYLSNSQTFTQVDRRCDPA